VGQYLQLPARESIAALSVLARLSSGETVREMEVQGWNGSQWISYGTNAVVSSSYELLTWSIGVDTVTTLRLVRVGTDGTPGIYLDSLTLTEVSDWVSTNEVNIGWTAAIDDVSGVSEYRYVAPAIGAVAPNTMTNGTMVNASFTNVLQSVLGQQGVLTGFLFAVDDDNDWTGDRSMGNVNAIIVKVDTNPPPVATAARASDAANSFLFDSTIDESSEIKVEWTPPGTNEAQAAGWRQSDTIPLSPWDSYVITYYEVADEDGNPLAGSVTNLLTRSTLGWSNVLHTYAFTNLVLSNLNFDAYYNIIIQGQDKAGNLGPATNVIGNTDRFIVTQGVNRVALDLQVFWKGIEGRDYDVLYVDSASGFQNTLSNQWQFMQYTNSPVMFDTGGVARLRPGELTNTTYRFYRVARTDRWQTNKNPRIASVEIYTTKALDLWPGENWKSVFFVPDTATVAYVFNTNLLPRSSTIAQSTRISWFGPSTGGQGGEADSVATAKVWLTSSGQWQWEVGGSGNANNWNIPLNQGFLLELPSTSAPISLVVIGLVPTQEVVTALSGGTGGSLGTNTFHVLSHQMPIRTPLTNMGFRGSGFIGHNNGVLADEVRILSAGGSGSLQQPKARIRLRSDQTTWQYYQTPAPGSASDPNLFVIEPDDAVIIVRRNTNTMTWTNRVIYTAPTKNFTP
jgi:hypothetical protein